jgi:NifB/MoaA-like Fe-S oxidoreductase
LNQELIDKLTEFGNIELNISVNCVNPIKRQQILGIKKDDNILERLSLLKGRLKFCGSCVYLPEFLGINDIEEITAVLSEAGADNIRLFLPGYTYKAKKVYDLDVLYKEVHDFLMILKPKYDIPIIIEPSIISDLTCRVEGIVKNTPSYIAGLTEGDLIIKVNGENTCTRVETFNKVYKSADPVLTVAREGVPIRIKIRKTKNSSPGFIMLYDIDSGIVKQINDSFKRYNFNNALIITSKLAYNLLAKLFTNSNLEFKYNIIAAENRFFGGNIKCAGLLTIQDISDTVKEYIMENKLPDIIILPPVMFDNKKTDLLGRNIKEIEDEFKIPVELI